MSTYTKKHPRRLLRAVLILIAAGALCYGALLAAVLWNSRDSLQGEPSVVVILGCQVNANGPSILLRDRLDTALDYLLEHPETAVVVSGGQGEDEPVSEAQAMRDYLVEHGVDAGRVFLEERSGSTLENLVYTRQLLEDEGYDIAGDILVVSNGFHLTRVKLLWGRVFGSTERLSTLAAPSSHLPSRLKMYVREPLALLHSLGFDWPTED
ncbi:MAG: YdcF family protein [Oscillospiraceae bacterium]|nr:YdcF family protein [Oscillospiraceae bacterium]